MRFYGFEYFGQPEQVTGTPHPTTGRQSIAGELAVFNSKKERDEWAAKRTHRTALTAEEARQHCQGITMAKYRQLISELEKEEQSRGTRKSRLKS